MNIKPEDIEDVSSHFIPLFQESRDSDIVKKIQIENTELYLIALIEHQSEADADMSFRLLRYMVYVWTDYTATQEKFWNYEIQRFFISANPANYLL